MKTYLKILFFGKEFLPKIFLAIFFLLLYNFFNAVSLGLVIPFLEILFSTTNVSLPEPSAALDVLDMNSLKEHFFFWLSTRIALFGKFKVLVYFSLFVGFAIFLKNVFRYASAYLIAPFEQGIIRNLRNAIFEKLNTLSLKFFTYHRKGKLMNLVTNDVQIVQEAVIGTIMPLLSDPITMLIFLGSMLFISWKLTLFSFVVLPLTGIFISRIAKTLKRRADEGQTLLDKLLGITDEFANGIRIIKSFGAHNYEIERFKKTNEEYTQTMIKFRWRSQLASPVTEILSILVVLTIIIYGGRMILSGSQELKASEFIGFIALFSQFIAPIKTFSSAISRIQKAVVSFQRIDKLLQTPEDPTFTTGKQKINAFEKEITCRDVTFAYEDITILKKVNFTIRKGELIALVGPSGAGKSTLVDLICRFYDPNEGDFFIDGKNYKEIHPDSLRALMGIVSQEGFLFNDTIRNNIAYGNPGYSNEEIIRAAKIANAHEFIVKLPEGYDTLIGERGTRLSGGQRQRIAIARAILKNPPILVLDEATSSLDTESEKLVQEAIENLMKNRTTITIAHRLSTIQKADLILVMDEGKIVEHGKHEDLLTKNGLYKKLHTLQFGE